MQKNCLSRELNLMKPPSTPLLSFSTAVPTCNQQIWGFLHCHFLGMGVWAESEIQSLIWPKMSQNVQMLRKRSVVYIVLLWAPLMTRINEKQSIFIALWEFKRSSQRYNIFDACLMTSIDIDAMLYWCYQLIVTAKSPRGEHLIL